MQSAWVGLMLMGCWTGGSEAEPVVDKPHETVVPAVSVTTGVAEVEPVRQVGCATCSQRIECSVGCEQRHRLGWGQRLLNWLGHRKLYCGSCAWHCDRRPPPLYTFYPPCQECNTVSAVFCPPCRELSFSLLRNRPIRPIRCSRWGRGRLRKKEGEGACLTCPAANPATREMGSQPTATVAPRKPVVPPPSAKEQDKVKPTLRVEKTRVMKPAVKPEPPVVPVSKDTRDEARTRVEKTTVIRVKDAPDAQPFHRPWLPPLLLKRKAKVARQAPPQVVRKPVVPASSAKKQDKAKPPTRVEKSTVIRAKASPQRQPFPDIWLPPIPQRLGDYPVIEQGPRNPVPSTRRSR
jgi:hypothetical protein